MKEIGTKFVGVILAFVVLVIAPLAVYSLSSDLTIQRKTYNDITKFLDVACDSGKIDAVTLGDFYLACSSYGASCDVTVTRYIKVVNPDGKGGTYTTYTPITIEQNMEGKTEIDLNKGDVLQARVKCLDYSGAKKITATIFKFMTDKFNLVAAERVRN